MSAATPAAAQDIARAEKNAGPSTADDTTNVDTPPLARRDSNVKQEIWDPEGICIIAGAGGMALAEEISGMIGLPSSSCLQARKADGESHIRLGANVRGRDVFVVQSTCTPANANVVELALILSACKRASARRVTAVAPYLAYSRQSQKSKSRVPVSAADIAQILEETEFDALLTVDIHDSQIAGFYSPRCAFDNCSIIPTAARFLADATQNLTSPVVVAPHASGVERAMAFVNALRRHLNATAKAAAAAAPRAESPVAAADVSDPSATARAAAVKISIAIAAEPPPLPKVPERSRPKVPERTMPSRQRGLRHSPSPGRSPSPPRQEGSWVQLAMLLPVERRGVKELELTGEIAGRDAILVDDMIDTGNTVVRASRELLARGASRVFAVATHGLLSGDAADRLSRCEELSMVVLTNTLPTLVTALPAEHKLRRKLAILSVAPLLAHKICEFAGMPPPDINHLIPTFPLHGGGSAASKDLQPAYLQMMQAQRGGGRRSTGSMQSMSQDMDDTASKDMDGSESMTTASEYSAF